MGSNYVVKDVSDCVGYEPCRSGLVIVVYLPLITLLTAFLTVFGSWRRRSHSSMLKYSIMDILFFVYVPDKLHHGRVHDGRLQC